MKLWIGDGTARHSMFGAGYQSSVLRGALGFYCTRVFWYEPLANQLMDDRDEHRALEVRPSKSNFRGGLSRSRQ